MPGRVLGCDMPGGIARNVVRGLAALALLSAFLGAALLPTPEDLPTIALDQPSLYRLEIALLVFYGCLLLITPMYSALAWGRLPTEISTPEEPSLPRRPIDR